NASEYIQVMLDTKFSLCPSGTGPNSIRLWESIEFNAIPVILADTLDLPGKKELWQRACIFIKEDEEEIKSLPIMLESLINDKAAIDDKLNALQELKNSLGLNRFAQHILDTSKFISKFNKVKKQFILNCENLSKNQTTSWRQFLSSVNTLTESNFEIILRNNEPKGHLSYSPDVNSPQLEMLDFSEDFAVLFNSKTLTPALMSKFDVIYLEPDKEPEYINYILYPLLKRNTGLDFGEMKPWSPMCTLITSMFNGDEYKKEFLENTSNFKSLSDIEMHIFRPASRGKEHFDLLDFGNENRSLIYFWLAKDPGLYDVWNLGVKISSARYCSNANIDDKRAPDHVFELVSALNKNKECVVGSSALRVTDTKGQSWDDSSNEIVWYKPNKPEVYGVEKLAKYDQNQRKIISHNIPHCMPVWSTRLHRKHGYFAENHFGPSSDWEFWLRCGLEKNKFYLLNKDLGLYYRAPQSYWRRDPNAKNYDDAIVNEYFVGEILRYKPLSNQLRSRTLGAMTDCFRKRDLWVGLASLYQVLANTSEHSEKEKDLVELICERFLHVKYDYLINAVIRLSPVAKVKDTFYDFLGFYLRGLDSKSIPTILFHSLLNLADKIITSEDHVLGWLAKAKVYQIVGNKDIEALCLAEAYRIDSYQFWSNVNRFYGLEENLAYFIDVLAQYCKLPKMSDFTWLTPGCTLYYLPDYSHGNPYQKLLYENISNTNVTAVGLSEQESILLDVSVLKEGDVLHIHWINVLFKGHNKETIASVLDNFLDKIRNLKSKGVKIVWTVHNRQNHEVIDLDLEVAFRQDLSRICDAVLLHHPMIANELSKWLDSNCVIEIIEHGLYSNYYSNYISKDEAKSKLGLIGENVVISTLGQVREYKNLPDKIDTISSVNKLLPINIKYIVAGRISCQKTLDKLNGSDVALIQNRFIKDEEVQVFLNASDFILLSYRDILTSGSFFQSVTFKKPVLSPQLGSLNYYICDGVNGYKYDSDSLAQILKDIPYVVNSTCALEHESLLKIT
ncbi:exostosin domain-containing protein, partial [Rheinheimera baltica]|uniref:exostosin domain-containing protein n=1 Tax=Rheinheimera baltica TaxID=67576 RepID=UPI00273EC116